MSDQRADVDEDRRAMRQPELGVDVHGRKALNLADVDAVVDDDDCRGGNAVVLEDVADGLEAAMNRSTCRYFQRENECFCR